MGDRGKMSSFPDPLELKELEGAEEDPSVFERITAVPGEVPDAPPDGTAGSDEAISGLHQRQDSRRAFAELSRAAAGRRSAAGARPRPRVRPEPIEEPRNRARPSQNRPPNPWKETGIRKAYGAKRPVLELELDDIPSNQPAPSRSPDALEARLPQRTRPSSRCPRPRAAPPTSKRRLRRASTGRRSSASGVAPGRAVARLAAANQPGSARHARSLRDGRFHGCARRRRSRCSTSSPNHEEARRCHDRCTDVLSQMYLARLGSLAQAVRVAVPNDQIRWLSLDHRAGFLLSLVDGHSTIEEILDISGMPRLDALRILYGLLDQRVIALCDRR